MKFNYFFHIKLFPLSPEEQEQQVPIVSLSSSLFFYVFSLFFSAVVRMADETNDLIGDIISSLVSDAKTEGIVVIHAQEINPEETEEALRKSTELDHPIMNQTVDIKETQDEEKEVQEVVHQQETSQQEELFSSSELSQKEEPQGKQALCTQQSDRMNLKLAAKEYQV